MTWATLDADGYVLRLHGREASALLNAGELTVVEATDEVASNAGGWRHVGGKWAKARRPVAERPQTYREARRRAYGQAMETDLQFEALFEAVAALATPAARAADPAAFAKLDALSDQIAAIKTAHPKPNP